LIFDFWFLESLKFEKLIFFFGFLENRSMSKEMKLVVGFQQKIFFLVFLKTEV